MRILFLQKDIFAKPAIMLLSAILKKAGHNCTVLVDDLEKEIAKKALQIDPDIIAFSITTGEYTWMSILGDKLKKNFKKLIICGGAHPTFYPEVINDNYLDAICVGEGEEAILEFVGALNRGAAITGIKNFIVKENGKIYQNEVRDLINDLDSIPFFDRTIYTRYGLYRNPKNALFQDAIYTNRGCPYNCSFCFNKPYSRIYKGKGKLLRRRTVTNVIEELKQLKQIIPHLHYINFIDDIFNLSPKAWLNDFLEQYKREIKIPFIILTRPDLIDEESIKKLKEANCYSVRIGVESGNDYIRNTILKKGLYTQQILKAAYIIKKYKINLHLFNFLGIPGETLNAALETFELNRRIHPNYAWCALLNPYPGTEIFNYAVQHNYLAKNFDFKTIEYSYFTGSPIKSKDYKKIWNLQKIFTFSVFLRLPTNIVKFLIKLPLSKFYELLFGIGLWIGFASRSNYIYALKIALQYFLKYLLKF